MLLGIEEIGRFLWIQQPLTRLRYLFTIFDTTKDLEGSALLSAIYNFVWTRTIRHAVDHSWRPLVSGPGSSPPVLAMQTLL